MLVSSQLTISLYDDVDDDDDYKMSLLIISRAGRQIQQSVSGYYYSYYFEMETKCLIIKEGKKGKKKEMK